MLSKNLKTSLRSWASILLLVFGGSLNLIERNLLLVFSGHTHKVPYFAGDGGASSFWAELVIFAIYAPLFVLPAMILAARRQALIAGDTTRARQLGFESLTSVALILFTAVPVTYWQIHADILSFLESPYQGGGAAFGLLLVFLYLPAGIFLSWLGIMLGRRVAGWARAKRR